MSVDTGKLVIALAGAAFIAWAFVDAHRYTKELRGLGIDPREIAAPDPPEWKSKVWGPKLCADRTATPNPDAKCPEETLPGSGVHAANECMVSTDGAVIVCRCPDGSLSNRKGYCNNKLQCRNAVTGQSSSCGP